MRPSMVWCAERYNRACIWFRRPGGEGLVRVLVLGGRYASIGERSLQRGEQLNDGLNTSTWAVSLRFDNGVKVDVSLLLIFSVFSFTPPPPPPILMSRGASKNVLHV